MGLREQVFGALVLVTSGCLDVPSDGAEPPPVVGSDAGESDARGAAPADAAVCADAFAVAYINRFDADPAGGLFEDMLVIAAIGDAVDLHQLGDAGDDSFQIELAMRTLNFDLLPAGAVSGALASPAADMIIGPLLDSSDWTEQVKPAFRVQFTDLEEGQPPPHEATARLTIGDSAVHLDFTITYGSQEEVVPLDAAIVYSACGE